MDVELEKSGANKETIANNQQFLFFQDGPDPFLCSEKNSNNLVPQRNSLMTCYIGLTIRGAYQSGIHLLVSFTADHKKWGTKGEFYRN